MREIINSVKNDYKFLVLYGFLIIIAYGFHMFNLTLYGDDWFAYQYNEFQYKWVVSIGRWLTRTIWMIFDDNYFVPVLSIITLLVSFYIAIKIHFKALNIDNKMALYLFILIFSFSPVFIEKVSFKMGNFNFSFVVLFVSLSSYYLMYYLKQKKIIYLLFSSFLLSLSVSLYQPAAIFSLQFIIIFIALQLINSDELTKLKIDVFNIIKFLILAIILYIIEVKLAMYYYGVSITHNKAYSIDVLLSMNHFSQSLHLFKEYVIQFLFKEQHFYPLIVKYMILIFLSLLFIFIIKDIKEKNHLILRLLLLTVLIAVLICSPFFIGIINTTAFRYNAIVSIASLHAILIVSIYYYTSKYKNKLLINLFFSFVALIVFIFIFQQNKASTIRYANSFRDIQIANRILNRIESNPHYSEMKRNGKCDLIIVGKKINTIYKRNKPFYNYTQGKMGTSIINANTLSSQIQHIRELFILIGLDQTIKFKFYFYQDISRIPKKIIKKKNIKDNLKWPSNESLIPVSTGFILLL